MRRLCRPREAPRFAGLAARIDRRHAISALHAAVHRGQARAAPDRTSADGRARLGHVFREIAHFLWHAPGTLRLKATLPQADLYRQLIDRADRSGLADRRRALVADLRGDVVEIGSGTGARIGYYAPGVRVAAIEPDTAFATLAEAPARAAAATVTLHEGTGEELPFPAARFDAAVLALVLCSVPSVPDVLAEIRRVLRPGGALRLLEHVRSDKRIAGWLMDRVDGVWLALNQQGCHLNRDPLPAIAAAGFEVTRAEPFQLWSAGLPAFPMRVIHAVAR
jgi:SAM-dependent methyltransferase